MKAFLMAFVALLMLAPSSAEAQFIETRTLGLDGAQQMFAGADAEAGIDALLN